MNDRHRPSHLYVPFPVCQAERRLAKGTATHPGTIFFGDSPKDLLRKKLRAPLISVRQIPCESIFMAKKSNTSIQVRIV